MLGNIDQPLWGWADPQAIYLLDFWKTVDPKIAFVLVYNRPESVISHLDHTFESEFEQRFKQWKIYNSALLNFYNLNKERCLLVHEKQVLESVEIYLQQVGLKIKVALQAPAGPEVKESDLISSLDKSSLANGKKLKKLTKRQIKKEKLLQAQKHSLTQPPHFEVSSFSDSLRVNRDGESPLMQYLAYSLVQDDQECIGLYEQMQAAANFPFPEDLENPKQRIISALNYWSGERKKLKALQNQDKLNKEKIEILKEQYQKNETLAEQRLKKIEQQDYLQKELEKSLDNKKEELIELKNKIKKRDAFIDELKLKSQVLQEKYRPAQPDEALLEQLHFVQEEYERLYLENQNLKKTSTEKKIVLYGAAERVKKDLPYRLGAVMIDKSRSLSGWLRMPRSISKERRKFLAEKKDEGPPLTEYYDYFEAERVMKHLSYRLGKTYLLHQEKFFGWFSLPFALFREIKTFRKEKSIS